MCLSLSVCVCPSRVFLCLPDKPPLNPASLFPVSFLRGCLWGSASPLSLPSPGLWLGVSLSLTFFCLALTLGLPFLLSCSLHSFLCIWVCAREKEREREKTDRQRLHYSLSPILFFSLVNPLHPLTLPSSHSAVAAFLWNTKRLSCGEAWNTPSQTPDPCRPRNVQL